MIRHNLRRAAPNVLQHHFWVCAPHTTARRAFGVLTKKPSDRLRILFCGSDAFSCASLAALHAERRRNEELVERIEVMVQPAKRVGRGLKKLAEVPCKALAEELGLTIHERSTFRDWTLPQGTNLIIAVSFGLFVPPRILSSAKYGGLNVHPSLLPHLRGPAPIHHAYLRGDPFTGVSLQTLDPAAFDHGTILAQTPAPGIPITPGQSFQGLYHELAAQGAQMLVQGLRDRVHAPPHASASRTAEEEPLVHAPKMSKADAEVDWKTWRAEDWRRRLSVFGAVWTRGAVAASDKDDGEARRVLFTKSSVASAAAAAGTERERMIRVLGSGDVRVRVDDGSGTCYVQDGEGVWMAVERAKLEGEREKDAAMALRTLFRDVE